MSLTFADLTGISAILLSVYTAFLQRRHNYRSLSPIAQICFHDYEDCVAVRIANAGLGPMTIKTFRAYNNSGQKSNLIDWMPPHPDNIFWDTYFEDLNGVTILPNSEAVVIRIQRDAHDVSEFSLFREKVRQALSSLVVDVESIDVYNRTMPTCKRSLDWFGRAKPKQNKVQ